MKKVSNLLICLHSKKTKFDKHNILCYNLGYVWCIILVITLYEDGAKNPSITLPTLLIFALSAQVRVDIRFKI